MKKRTGKKESETSNELVQEEVIQENPIVKEVVQENQKSAMDLFNDFTTTESEFVPEENETQNSTDNKSTTSTSKNPTVTNVLYVPNIEEQWKIKMLVGLASFILVGLNVFLFNKIRGSDIKAEQMQLSEAEQKQFHIYLHSPKVIEMINKIPTGIIGFIHFEYTLFQKHGTLGREVKEKSKLE